METVDLGDLYVQPSETFGADLKYLYVQPSGNFGADLEDLYIDLQRLFELTLSTVVDHLILVLCLLLHLLALTRDPVLVRVTEMCCVRFVFVCFCFLS